MKKILLFLVLSVFIFPVFVGAHGDTEANDSETGFEMMEHMEDKILGDKLHKEMEMLVVKMMNGDLSEEEIDRLSTLIEDYPGPYNMVLNRMAGNFNQLADNGNKGNMDHQEMYSRFENLTDWSWFMFLGNLIWIIAGIVLIVFLGRRMVDN